MGLAVSIAVGCASTGRGVVGLRSRAAGRRVEAVGLAGKPAGLGEAGVETEGPAAAEASDCALSLSSFAALAAVSSSDFF